MNWTGIKIALQVIGTVLGLMVAVAVLLVVAVTIFGPDWGVVAALGGLLVGAFMYIAITESD